MNPRPASSSRIPEIDGLRAFAVLSVILFHLNHAFLPGGFTGVDVFFVISGYVVCRSMLQDPPARFLPFIGTFYIRRIFRIYPVLLLVLLCCGVLSTMFIPDAYLSQSNRSVGFLAFYGLGNIGLVVLHNDYFALNNDYNPFAHTWSLGVEEQYYIIFPLILFCMIRSNEGSFSHRRFTSALLPTLLLVSLGYSVWQTYHNPSAAYFLLPSRFWELAAGAMLHLAHRRQALLPRSTQQSTLLIAGGLAVLVLSVILANPVYFPFPLALGPVLGTLLCIAGVSGSWKSGLGDIILGSSPVVGIGKISYSLYLWHWVVIVLLRWTVGIESVASMLTALPITFLLATTSYHLVETRFWRPHLLFPKRKVLILALGFGLIVAGSLLFYVLVKGPLASRIALTVVTRNSADWKPEVKDGPGPAGKRWSNRQLFCIGDSHAWAYGGLLRTLQQQDGASVYTVSKPGQGIGLLVWPKSSVEADARRKETIDYLRKMAHPGDVVFLASLRVPRLCEQWGPLPPPPASESPAMERSRKLAIQQGEQLIRDLQQLNLKVIIPAPLPVFKAPPYRGSDWFNRMNPVVRPGFEIDLDFTLNHRALAMQSIAEVHADLPGVIVWDPLWTFRNGNIISAFEGSRPLFLDGDHLSNYGGIKLYPSFKPVLEKVWP